MTALPNIMFVDDEPNVISAIRRMLHHRRAVWSLHFASSGAEALARMEALGGIDVIVSDMRMPQMDGAALLGEVAKRFPDSVRFILSGQSDAEALFRAVGPCHQYLSKPIDGQKLEQRIEQSLALRRRIDPRIRAVLSRLRYVPSLPSVYRDLAEELAANCPRSERIDAIISRDPGVSAKVLQVANSAYFNRAREAKTPSQAIGFLGFDLVKALVLSCGAAGSLGHIDGSGLSAEKVIEHSIGVATLAAALMRQAGGSAVDVEDASAAGLLHDIGMLLLAENQPQAYGRVTAEKQRTGLPLETLERAVFGVSHAEAGAFLLGTWGLNDGIAEAVALHHDSVEGLTGIGRPADAVALASILMAERDGAPFATAPGQLKLTFPEGIDEAKLQAWRVLRDGVAKVEVRA